MHCRISIASLSFAQRFNLTSQLYQVGSACGLFQRTPVRVSATLLGPGLSPLLADVTSLVTFVVENPNVARVVSAEGQLWIEGTNAGTTVVRLNQYDASFAITVNATAVMPVRILNRVAIGLDVFAQNPVEGSDGESSVLATTQYLGGQILMAGDVLIMESDILTSDGRVNSFRTDSSTVTLSSQTLATALSRSSQLIAVETGDAIVQSSLASDCFTVQGYSTFAITVVSAQSLTLSCAAELVPFGDALIGSTGLSSFCYLQVALSSATSTRFVSLADYDFVFTSSPGVTLEVSNTSSTLLLSSDVQESVVTIFIELVQFKISGALDIQVVRSIQLNVVAQLVALLPGAGKNVIIVHVNTSGSISTDYVVQPVTSLGPYEQYLLQASITDSLGHNISLPVTSLSISTSSSTLIFDDATGLLTVSSTEATDEAVMVTVAVGSLWTSFRMTVSSAVVGVQSTDVNVQDSIYDSTLNAFTVRGIPGSVFPCLCSLLLVDNAYIDAYRLFGPEGSLYPTIFSFTFEGASDITVDSTSGLITLEANSQTPAIVSVLSFGASTSLNIIANIDPVVGDVDMGASTGFALPSMPPGAAFDLPLRVNCDRAACAAFEFDVYLDASQLQLLGVSAGQDMMGQFLWRYDDSSGTLQIASTATGSIAGVVELVVLHLRVQATSGTLVLINGNVVTLEDASGQVIGAPLPRPFVAGNLAFTVRHVINKRSENQLPVGPAVARATRRGVCANADDYPLGDVNIDCVFNLRDILFLRSVLLTSALSSTPLSSTAVQRMDFDGDGSVTVADMTFAYKSLVGLLYFLKDLNATVSGFPGCGLDILATLDAVQPSAFVFFVLQFDGSQIPADSVYSTANPSMSTLGGAGFNGLVLQANTDILSPSVFSANIATNSLVNAIGISVIIATFDTTQTNKWQVSPLVQSPMSMLAGAPNPIVFSVQLDMQGSSATFTEQSGYLPRLTTVVPFVTSLCLNPCLSGPCSHNSTCLTSNGNFTCACTKGYEGRLCETVTNNCLPHPCGVGTCTNRVAGYSCTCPAGYDPLSNCSNINECIGVTCQHGGVCVDNINAFNCSCPAGYLGKFCETGTAPSLSTVGH